MKKFRKVLMSLLFLIVGFSGAIFFACEPDNSKMVITLSSSQLEITLGENDNTGSIRATVTDAADKNVSVEYDSADIKVTTSYLGEGVTEITVVAYRQCSNVDVLVKGATKSVGFTVNASLPISSIVPKQNTYSVSYDKTSGGRFVLSDALFRILPEGTNQTALTFSLTSEIEGVSIVDNVLTLSPNLSTVPSSISVEVISAFKDSVKTSIQINVVNAIDLSKVLLMDESGAEITQDVLEISRNNQASSLLTVSVFVPFSVTKEKLSVKPKFAYNDLSIVLVNDVIIEKFDTNASDAQNYYLYTFKFTASNDKSLVGQDRVWFELCYEQYPEIVYSTVNKDKGVLTIEVIDEITGISATSNNVSLQSPVNLYTSYSLGNEIEGLEVKFEAIPTTAISGKLSLNVNVLDPNLAFLVIKNSNGGEVEFTNGKYLFDSGETFYFMVKKGFTPDSGISVVVKSERNDEISKTVEFKFNEGISEFGFVNSFGENEFLEATRTYYLKNTGDHSRTKIRVGIAPASIDLTSAEIIVEGDVFTVSNNIAKNGTLGDANIYELEIFATDIGTGSLTIKYESGQKITCQVVVIEGLEDVKITIEPTFNTSSAVGNIAYNNGTLEYAAVKNGQSLPLVFTGNTDIQSTSYEFFDYVYTDTDDVYDPNSNYNLFGTYVPDIGDFGVSSEVISSNYLKSLKHISPLKVGKVWVKAVFGGKQIVHSENEKEYLYVDTFIEKYFLVEVYNPITSLSVDVKNVDLYAYDEVGEVNKDLSTKVITVSLNKGTTKPTYNKIEWTGITYDEATGIYEYFVPNSGVTNFTIEDIGNGQFKICALTRNDDGFDTVGDFEFETAIVNLVTCDLNLERNEWNLAVKVSMQKPTLVESIATTNVSSDGIYLVARNLANDDISLTTFKLLTKVEPQNALNKDVVYRFIPDANTSSDIISISENGTITVTGEYSGSGVIRIIPKDSVFVDEFGHEYYRDNLVYKDVRIFVSDGRTKQTALRIYNLSEITNSSLHYVLMNDAEFTGNERIFDTFSGGLYGKLEENKVSTITFKGSLALFNIIGIDAVIEDLYLCGTVNDASMLAVTNNGVIRNVTVDLYTVNLDNGGTQYKASKIDAQNQDVAGGIVATNNRTIENCTFAGSIIGADVVGGIAGINTGTIQNSAVLFYNMLSNAMTLDGTIVGGIVGEITGVGTISRSYVYNYSNNEVLVGLSGKGAIVGKISSNNAQISECFAEIGADNNFYAQKDSSVDATEEKLIKNSYIISKTKGAEDKDIITFTYFMQTSTGKILKGSTSNVSDTFGSVFYGPKQIWNRDSETNYGYPYLNNVSPVLALSNEELKALSIKNTRLSLEEQNGNAVMYLYKPFSTVLTAREISVLKARNSINISELFGTNRVNGVLISSSDNSVIECGVNSLQVKSVGTVTLTIESKYDLTVTPKQVSITVLYYTQGLDLVYNNQYLNSESQINIRTHSNAILTSSVVNSFVLVDRPVAMLENDYIVKFADHTTLIDSDYVVGSSLGNHIVLSSFSGDSIKLDAFLQLQDVNSVVNDIIKLHSLKQLTLIKTYGPFNITVSASSISISPSDEITLDIQLSHDKEYSDEEKIKVFVYDSSDKIVQNSVFDVILTKNTALSDEDLTVYKAQIKVKTNVKAQDTNYTIKFATKFEDVYANVKVNLLAQEILRIDINNFAQRASNDSEKSYYYYYPNNVLSPGTSGLLDIMIYPAYATYDYITVTSSAVNNANLRLIAMRKDGNGYMVDSAQNFEFVPNGVKIYAKTNDSEIGRYYVRVIVPSSVSIDSVFDIVVNAYQNGNDTPVDTQTYPLIIVPQENPGITVNGQSTIFALRGDTILADLVIDQTQQLKSIELFEKDSNKRLDDNQTNAYFNNDFADYATKYKKGTITINIGENVKHFRVKVTSSRFMNGVEEIKDSYLIIYVIDFELDIDKTSIDGSYNNVALGDKYFYHSLEFNFVGKYAADGFVGKQAFNEFTANKYYKNASGDYIVNETSETSHHLLENLYYVNNSTYTPVVTKTESGEYVNTENNYIREFVIDESGDNKEIRFIGRNNGSQDMLLEIKAQMPDGNIRTYRYFFTIKISDPTSDDFPNKISSASEFYDALNNDTEEDYILTSNIFLYDYTTWPDTSKIRSLDGNGYQIVIIGFNNDNSEGEANFALFNDVSDNTTLKNLRVNIYHAGIINIDSSKTTNVNVAPIAINNAGIITNCEVVSYRYFTNQTTPEISGINVKTNSAINVTAKTAGFVINNTGVITNSRVGGTDINVYKIGDKGSVTKSVVILAPFVISSFGEISGFVHTNSGHIASSYASNERIINNSNIDYATITTGFVINNSGSIAMSYSKGVKENSNDVHATQYGIETSGISAGFAYLNSGVISDSYSNISLTNLGDNPGRNSAGFVYRNAEKGTIKTSLSLSRIVGATTTQMNFAGVNDYGEYQNLGQIENSYYYDQRALEDSSILVEAAYGEGAKLIGGVNTKDYYYGFSFTSPLSNDDGIWTMTSCGPELVGANDKAVSLRYESNLNTSQRPMYAYVDEYRYGSKVNPILIRTAQEFNRVFSGTDNSSASRYINLEKSQITGNYRLISDINLQELISDKQEQDTYKLASSKMTLLGKFDGNGFTITGLALSDADMGSGTEHFGLFGSISSGAIVMNLNLIMGSTNNEGDIFGVEAKGIKYVGALAGTVFDAKVMNVSLKSLYENTNSVTVRGKNVVGGLIGKVYGNSYIFNLSVKDISVTAVMYPTNYTSGSYLSYNTYYRTVEDLNSNISYAGGVVGIIDTFTEATVANENYIETQISGNGNAVMLKTTGVNQISAGTVGGIAGFVGALTVVQDALYELKQVEKTQFALQGLYSYNGFAGGIVGYNSGFLRQVRSEHEYSWQIGVNDDKDDSIEDRIDDYYKGDYSVDRGNTELFMSKDYTPIAIGGLVGLERSGKIEKSYSKLNVINTKDNIYAGGVIGINEGNNQPQEINLRMEEVYAMGDVHASISAGIIGLSNKNVSFEKVNAVNYWGHWLVEPESVGTAYAMINNNSTVNSLESDIGNCVALKSDEIKFTEEDDKVSTPKYNNDTSSKALTSLSNISGQGDDGELFDIFFKGNDWDNQSWQRDENELFPHILFGYVSKIIRITKQSDIEKMRTAKQSDIFVIDPIDDATINYVNEKERYIKITKPIAPIAGFSSKLMPVDSNYEYGFYYDSNPSRGLFSSTYGASFNDFTVKYADKNVELESRGNTRATAMLVENATNTTFVNLKFTNVTINTSSSNAVGILTGTSVQGTSFNNITFESCSINQTSSTSKVSLGLLFGNAELSQASISNTKVNGCSINISGGVGKDSDNMSNIGLLGGQLISDITIDYQDDSINGSINLNADVNNANIGYLFGSSQNVTIEGKNSGTLASIKPVISASGNEETTTEAKEATTLPSLSKVNIGGLIGNAQNGTVSNINVVPNFNIQSNVQGISLGGLFGIASSITVNDCEIVGNDNDETSIPVINVYNINGEGNYIGSLAGQFTGVETATGDINNIKSYTSLNLSAGDELTKLYAGGLFGTISNSKVTNAVNYADVKFTNDLSDKEGKSIILYLAGFVANASNSTFTNCVTTGDIKNVVASGDKDTKSIISLTASPFVAEATYASLVTCITTGNTYPIYGEETDSEGNVTGIIKSVSNQDLKLNSLVYGGLIGSASDTCKIESCLSIATLFNKKDREIAANDYEINVHALVGSRSEKEEETLSTNKYAHVYTLVTDNIGENVKFESIKGLIEGQLKGNLKASESESNSEFVVWDNDIFKQGTKLNPNSVEELKIKTEINDTYFYLGSGDTGITSTVPKLTNSVIIADGETIAFNNEFKGNKEETTLSPFKEIDQNSYISGIVVLANYVKRDTETLSSANNSDYTISGLANKNSGIIYSCNVRGFKNEKNNENAENIVITGTIDYNSNNTNNTKNSRPIAGFVNKNEGLIKESYTALNLRTLYSNKDEKKVSVAGFVKENSGLIVNCYSSGSITNVDITKSLADINDDNEAKIYLFAPGTVYDSYTISRLVYYGNITNKLGGKKLFNRSFAFDNSAENCFYDQFAVEALLNSENDKYKKITKDVSLPYPSSTSESEEKSTKTSETLGIYKGNMACDIDYAFGYGSFCQGAYNENISYMRHATGTGNGIDDQDQSIGTRNEIDDPYQIPNLGKLKQIQSGGADEIKYYKMINSINASCISDEIKWTTKDIENVTLDGNVYEIQNLMTDKGGIFNTLTNCNLHNWTLDNITPNLQSITSVKFSLGLLANKAKTTEISNIKIISVNNSALMLNGDIQILYFGNVVGSLESGPEQPKSTLESCSITSRATEEANVYKLSLDNYTNINYVIGGIVGYVNGGTVSNCHLDQNYNILFEEDASFDNKSFVIGGIAGLMSDAGKIENSYINADMEILTMQNNNASGSNLTLYAGGIVGGVGYFAVGTNGKRVLTSTNPTPETKETTNTDTNNDANIDKCYIYFGNSINAGNHYIIDECYLGGISGYGGKITNCDNKAELVRGMAKYVISDKDKEFKTDFSADNPNIYVDGDDILGRAKLIKQFRKQIFMTIDQKAYVAGIANDYQSIEYSVNQCEKIQGGMKARKLHSYLDFDVSAWNQDYWVAKIAIDSGILMIETSFALGLTSRWIVRAMGIGAIAGGIFTLSWPKRNVDVYIAEGNGYEYNLKDVYVQQLLKKTSNVLDGTLIGKNVELIKNTTETPWVQLEYNTPQNESLLHNESLLYNESLPILKTYEGYKYATDNKMVVYNIYYDAIGLSDSGTKKDTAIAIEGQVYEEVTIENQTQKFYGFNDNGRARENGLLSERCTTDNIFEKYGLVYNIEKNDVISNLTTISGAPDLTSNDGWKANWTTNSNNEITLSNSVEVKRTDLATFVNENVKDIVIDTDNNKKQATITVKNLEDYRTMTAIVNELPDDITNFTNTYGSNLTNDQKTKVAQLETIVKEGQLTINIAPDKGNAIQLINVNPIGTDKYPFNGTISGTLNRDGNYPALKDVEIGAQSKTQGEIEEGTIGIVGYGKNVTIQNLTVGYKSKERQYPSGSFNIGGLIGQVNDSAAIADVSNITISNVDVAFNFVNGQKSDSVPIIASNIGGFIGHIGANNKATISNSNVINSNITITNEKGSTSEYGIGGFIGKVDNSAVEVQNSTSGININSKSSNNIVGGMVGYMQASNLTAKDIIVSGNVCAESDKVTIAGGVIGKIANKVDGEKVYGNTCKLSGLTLNLSKVSATAGKPATTETGTPETGTTTYAGGIIGYLDGTIKENYLFENIKIGSEYVTYDQRMYILSGIGGSEYSSYAYADDFVGNRNDGISSIINAIANNSTVYAKSLSMADPDYKDYPLIETVESTEKLSNTGRLRSEEVYREIGTSTVNNGIKTETKQTSILKIDVHEFETQVNTSNKNAFINGEQFTVYNYQKQYIIIVSNIRIFDNVKIDDVSDQTVYGIEEIVYRYTISGQLNEEFDYNLTESKELEFVTAYKFYTKAGDAGIYNRSGTVIELTSRTAEKYYIANLPILQQVTKVGDEKEEGVSFSTSGGSTTNQTRYVIDNKAELDISVETTYASVSIDIGEDKKITGNIGKEENVTNKNYAINVFGNDVILTWDKTENKGDPVKMKKPLISGAIYTTDSRDGKWMYVDIDGAIKSVDTSSKTIDQVYIDFGDEQYKLMEDRESKTMNEVLEIKGVLGPIMKMDNKNDNKKRVFIVSVCKKGETISSYTDYVYLIDSSQNNKVFYLGYITYDIDNEILNNLDKNTPFKRNALFFPYYINKEGVCEYQAQNHNNCLLSLDKISEFGNEGNDKFEFTTKSTQTINKYYIDVTKPITDYNFKGSRETIETTHKFSLNYIDAKDINNIVATIDYTKEEGEPKHEDIGNGTKVLEFLGDPNVTFKIIENNKTNEVVIESTDGGNLKYYLYKLSYNNEKAVSGCERYELIKDGNSYTVDESVEKIQIYPQERDHVEGESTIFTDVSYYTIGDVTYFEMIETGGKTSGKISISEKYDFSYDTLGRLVLTETSTGNVYVIDYIEGKFVVVEYNFNYQITLGDKTYTVSESTNEISITYGTNTYTKAASLGNIAITDLTGTISDARISISLEREEAQLNGEDVSYIQIKMPENEKPIILSPTDLSERSLHEIKDRDDYNVKMYIYGNIADEITSNTVIHLYVQHNGEWTRLKTGTDMAMDKNGAAISSVEIKTYHSIITCLDITYDDLDTKYDDKDLISYDIDNGIRYEESTPTSGDIESLYTNRTVGYTLYSYIPTNFNYDPTKEENKLKTHSKLVIPVSNTVIDVDYVIDTNELTLIPFDNDDAIKIADSLGNSAYYTLYGGYKIEGTVDSAIDSSSVTSFGVKVSGTYIIKNDAKFTDENDTEHIVKEFVVARKEKLNISTTNFTTGELFNGEITVTNDTETKTYTTKFTRAVTIDKNNNILTITDKQTLPESQYEIKDEDGKIIEKRKISQIHTYTFDIGAVCKTISFELDSEFAEGDLYDGFKEGESIDSALKHYFVTTANGKTIDAVFGVMEYSVQVIDEKVDK